MSSRQTHYTGFFLLCPSFFACTYIVNSSKRKSNTKTVSYMLFAKRKALFPCLSEKERQFQSASLVTFREKSHSPKSPFPGFPEKHKPPDGKPSGGHIKGTIFALSDLEKFDFFSIRPINKRNNSRKRRFRGKFHALGRHFFFRSASNGTLKGCRTVLYVERQMHI